MKIFSFLKSIPINIQLFYRVLMVNGLSEIVWDDLIKMLEKQGWGFGRDDNQKSIEMTFSNSDKSSIILYHEIGTKKLEFKAVILSDFNSVNAHDIMILSSYINNLLNFGMVRVDTISNCVQFVYSGDLLLYFLYPIEKLNDMIKHIEVAKECQWAFSYMLDNGKSPAFVVAEFLKRNDQ